VEETVGTSSCTAMDESLVHVSVSMVMGQTCPDGLEICRVCGKCPNMVCICIEIRPLAKIAIKNENRRHEI